jgi:hypothetical protein
VSRIVKTLDMNEKEKNPRLRHSKYLSPKAQAERRGYLDILEADGPQSELGHNIPLAEAAARLGCKQNDLLNKGRDGELDIYAPVLDEGVYVWPVTDGGLPHSRVVGAADPLFSARFQVGDYGALTPSDIKKIGLGARVIPEGYVFPELTLWLIADWEAERSLEEPGRASEWRRNAAAEMRALVKQVPWVHSSNLGSRNSERQTIDPKLSADMLRIDSRYAPPIADCVDASDLADPNEKPTELAAQTGSLEAQAVAHTDVQAPSNITVHRIDDPKRRKHKLHHLIEKAMDFANSDDIEPVWQQLKELALNGVPPFTGIVKDLALVYESDRQHKDGSTQKTYTRNALEIYLRRKRDRLTDSGNP